jgi:hypothetical protein
MFKILSVVAVRKMLKPITNVVIRPTEKRGLGAPPPTQP